MKITRKVKRQLFYTKLPAKTIQIMLCGSGSPSVPKRCLEITAVTLETLHSKGRDEIPKGAAEIGHIWCAGKGQTPDERARSAQAFRRFLSPGCSEVPKAGKWQFLTAREGMEGREGPLGEQEEPKSLYNQWQHCLEINQDFYHFITRATIPQHSQRPASISLLAFIFRKSIFKNIFKEH